MPFTASIIERQFVYIPDRILKLGGAAWVRKMPVLTMPWQRLRVGLLCAVTPDSTNNIYETLFTLGICSGTEFPGASANTLNFMGASIIGAATAGAVRTLTYTASTNGPYYSATAGYFFAKTEGSIYSTAAGFNPVAMLSTTQAVTGVYPRRTLFVLDITKPIGGTGPTTMTIYGPSSTLVQTTDYRPDDLQNALDQLGTPTIRGQAMTVLSTNSTVVTSPMVGVFDTVEVFWSNNNNPLEISAIGATVIAPPYYSDLGVAIDSFESYGTTTGSIAEASFLSGGSGWGATGSIGYDTTASLSANTSNLAPQVYGQQMGTTCTPNDGFEQYATGTINSGVTVNAGTFLFTPATVVTQLGTGAFIPQVYTQYVGTTNQPDETFEQYLTGTVNSGTTVNAGSFWPSAATSVIIVGLPAPQVYTQYVGTSMFPFDNFESYTVNNGSTTYGTTTSFAGSAALWGGTGTVYTSGSVAFAGTVDFNSYPIVYDTYGGTLNIVLYGTALGLPYDTFEQYGTGAVTSGVTINAGTGWTANGLVNSYILA